MEAKDILRAVRANRDALLADPQRPTYHFVAPEGVCAPFDPNGAIFWKGLYHLFYIFHDDRGHCWGHVSSKDLVHWRHHPTALFPSPEDPDKGTFSGNCFLNLEGRPTILYHGIDAGNCIAVAEDDRLDTWQKLASNPIVPNPAPNSAAAALYRSWDPHGWTENGKYYAVFGGPKAALFSAAQLGKWRYVGPFMEGEEPAGVNEDDDISCPDFFSIGGKHMLLCISHKRGCRYYLGRWENERFTPDHHGWMNWPGGTFFSPESLLDGRGRRIMWAWVADYGVISELPPAGWSGVMCLPRELWLGVDGALRMRPVPELEMLRMNHRRTGPIPLGGPAPASAAVDAGDCLELRLMIDPGSAKRVGLVVRQSPDGEEQTPIVVDIESGELRIELAHSSAGGYLRHFDALMHVDFMDHKTRDRKEVSSQATPFTHRKGELLELRVFLDRSIVEVFVNERQAVTQRIDPMRSDSLNVSVFSEEGEAILQTMDVWDMAPANPW